MSTTRLLAPGIGLLALTAILPLGGCPKRSPEAGTVRDTFVFARGSDASRLDPQTVDDGESVLVCANLFEGLVRYDDGVGIVPALAVEWTRAEDGLSWTFRLREGVSFHDGEPFDADAVLFTFARLLEPDHPFNQARVKGSSFYADIARVEKVGPHEVRFHLKRPVASALFLGSLTIYNAFIVPPKAMERIGLEDFSSQPIGTGPYKLGRWVRDQKITLEAFPGYWGEKPKTPKVVVVTIKENSSRLQQLQSGEIDAMDGLNPIDVDPLAKDPRVVLARAPAMSTGYLALNTQKPALADPRVRRAIALAIDRAKIVALTFRGHGEPAAQVTPASLLPGGPALAAPDPAEARRLLAAASREGGLDLTLWAMPNPRPYFPEPKKVAELIKEDLAAIGVRCEIVTYPWTQYLEKTERGEHDMCLLGWTVDVADADNILFTFFASANHNATNYSFFADAEVDRWLADAQALGDESARRALYRRVEDRVRDLAPLVPLTHPLQLAATRAGVTGLEVHPTGRRLFQFVEVR